MKPAAFDANGRPLYSEADVRALVHALCVLVELDDLKRMRGTADYMRGSASFKAWQEARRVALSSTRHAPLESLRPDLSPEHPAAGKGGARSAPTAAGMPRIPPQRRRL